MHEGGLAGNLESHPDFVLDFTLPTLFWVFCTASVLASHADSVLTFIVPALFLVLLCRLCTDFTAPTLFCLGAIFGCVGFIAFSWAADASYDDDSDSEDDTDFPRFCPVSADDAEGFRGFRGLSSRVSDFAVPRRDSDFAVPDHDLTD